MHGQPKSDLKANMYTGGVTWRRCFVATTPLATLVIDADGIAIGPTWRQLRFVWRLFGLPSARWGWSDVEKAELVRVPFDRAPRAVAFAVDGKSLIFGSVTPHAILNDVARFVPKKIAGDERLMMFFVNVGRSSRRRS